MRIIYVYLSNSSQNRRKKHGICASNAFNKCQWSTKCALFLEHVLCRLLRERNPQQSNVFPLVRRKTVIFGIILVHKINVIVHCIDTNIVVTSKINPSNPLLWCCAQLNIDKQTKFYNPLKTCTFSLLPWLTKLYVVQ